MADNKAFIKKYNEKLSKRTIVDKVLIEYAGSNMDLNSVFYDQEYGKFTTSTKKVLTGYCHHPERTKKNLKEKRKRKPLTIEQINERLSKKFPHIVVLEYCGTSTGKSKFLDKTFGEFYGSCHLVMRGQNVHQDRQILNRENGKSKVDMSEMVNNIQKTMLERYGVKNASNLDSVIRKREKTKISNGHVVLYGGKTRKDLSKDLPYNYHYFGSLIKKYGFEKTIKMCQSKDKTIIEQIIKDILLLEKIVFQEEKCIKNDCGKRYFCDFVVENKLAIECDGLFWHCDKINEDKRYHQNKRQVYLNSGFDPLFFRSNEIENKTPIVKSIIMNRLGNSQRVLARKCTIREVDSNVSNEFYQKNHLMGSGRGKIRVGLFFENVLVTLIQICKKKQNHYDVSRFCHKINHNVVGGFSKLLKFCLNNYQIESLQTFIDLRYGNGEYLEKLGFIKKTEHLSFKWTDGKNTYNRMKFPGELGYENGLYKIWDCGQRKYIKTNN